MCILISLCSLAKFDLANRRVCKPIHPHTFYAPLLVFDKTLAQPDFAGVNCSRAVMSVFYFYSPVLTRSLIFCNFELLCRSVECIFFRYPNLEC